jgi:hypothetical protein
MVQQHMPYMQYDPNALMYGQPPRSMPTCKYYLKFGQCTNPNCQFYHPLNTHEPQGYHPYDPSYAQPAYVPEYPRPPRRSNSFRNVFIPPTFQSNTFIPQNSQLPKTVKEPYKTIFVTKIPLNFIEEEHVRETFQEFGQIENIILHREFRQAKVTFQDLASAKKAHDSQVRFFNSVATSVEYDSEADPIEFKYIPENGTNPNASSEIEKKNQALLARLSLKRSKEKLLEKLVEQKKIITEALEKPDITEESKTELTSFLEKVNSNITETEEFMKKMFPQKSAQSGKNEGDEGTSNLSTSNNGQSAMAENARNGIPSGKTTTIPDNSKLTPSQIQDLYILDNRPGKFVLKGFSEENKPSIEEYFSKAISFISITFDYDDQNGALIRFRTRPSAETAIRAFSKKEIGNLEGTWILEHDEETQSGIQPEIQLDTKADANLVDEPEAKADIDLTTEPEIHLDNQSTVQIEAEPSSDLKRTISEVEDEALLDNDINPEKLAKSEV